MKLGEPNKTFESARMLNAFVLFREQGLKAVETTYPEYKQFVVEHSDRSVREVKNELFDVVRHTSS